MKTLRSVLVVTTLAAATALAGCSPGHPGPSSPTPASSSSASPSVSRTPSASSPVGSWGEDATGKPGAVFTSDGTVSGSDGCNHFSGPWSDTAGTITVGPLIATAMACPGMDTWLTQMTSVKVVDDTLIVYKGTQKIGTLTRA